VRDARLKAEHDEFGDLSRAPNLNLTPMGPDPAFSLCGVRSPGRAPVMTLRVPGDDVEEPGDDVEEPGDDVEGTVMTLKIWRHPGWGLM
jgi:hypothetical protein